LSVALLLEISRSKVVVLERAANLIILIVIIIRGIVLLRRALVMLVHPLTLAGVLIIYAVVTRGVVGYISCSWIIYMLVLIFLGGVIVLVVYMTTLAANEKFILIERYANNFVLGAVVFIGIRGIAPIGGLTRGLAPNRNMVTVIFEPVNATLYIFRVLYLLLALICVVKVIKLEKGPLVIRA